MEPPDSYSKWQQEQQITFDVSLQRSASAGDKLSGRQETKGRCSGPGEIIGGDGTIRDSRGWGG